MGNTQLTPEQLHALLQFASAKLGISQETLARTVQSGNLQDLGLSPDQSRKLEGLMGSKERAEDLLKSPQLQALLNQLQGGRST